MRPESTSLLSLVLTISVGALTIGCSDQGVNAKDGPGNGTDGTTGGTGDDPDTGPNYEEGCILVDGAGGYRWINDAIDVAEDGSVIELCATQGDSVHEEAVLVDKRVNIVGPGRDNFMLAPPVNENGVVVTASGASVSGLSVYTTRTGVVVSAAAGSDVTGVTLEDIKVYDAPNWGISVEGASDITVSNVELGNNTYGGISVDEATVLVDGSILQSNYGYGIFATNGSEVTIAATEVIGTQVTDPDNYVDGHGVYGTEGSLIATEGSVFLGSAFVNVFAEEADLDMSGDDVEGGLYGVVDLNGSVVMDGVTITDGAYHAAFLLTNGSVTLSNLAVSGDPAVVAQTADSEWNVTDGAGNTPVIGSALLIQSPDIALSDSTIVGYNNAGLVLFTADTGTAAVARVTLSDNGQHGIYMAGHQLTLEDVDVTGMFEIADVAADTACTMVDRYAAAVFAEGTVVWSGGTVANNQGYGASGVRTAMNISGVDFAANGCANVMSFGGDLIAENNSFTESIPRDIDNDLLAANIVLYQGGSSTISGNLFYGNQRAYDRQTTEYDAGSYTYYYVYHEYTGADVFVYQSGPTTVSSNTFQDGVIGVQAYDTELVASNNTWERYLSQAISVSGDVDTEVSDNDFVEVGGVAVACSSGRVAMEDNVIEGGGVYSYSYDYYRDGELQFETDTNSLSTAVNLYTCSLSMEGDEIRNQASNALYSYNGSSTDTMTIEVVDVTIDTVNENDLGYAFYGAIFAYAFYGTTDMYIENSSITNVMGDHGVEMYNGNLDATGVVTMVDSVIDTVARSGVYLYGSGAYADLQNTSVSNTAEAGLYAYSSAGLTLSDVVITGSGTDNIQLDSSATLVIDDAAPSTSTLATEYGLYCGASVEVTNCSALDLAGNTLGTQSGCDAFCDAD